MGSKLPESARLTYARQLADEAKTLVPGMERLAEIAAELRADDLYRLLGFDTWERFCVGYLGVSKSTANRWIAGPKPKSIAAGQKVAAAQNAPVVESDALKSDKSPEGLDQQDYSGPASEPTKPGGAVSANDLPTPSGPSSEGGERAKRTAPALTPPSGQSSGGAEIQLPAEPTDVAAPKRPTSRSAPPDPPEPKNDTGPVPSLRQEASTAFRTLHDATEGIGAKWTLEEATYWENRTQREMDAWRKANRIDQPKRRQGTISRPQAAVLAGRAITAPANGSLARREVTPMFKP